MADKVHLLYLISFSRDSPETSVTLCMYGLQMIKFGRDRSKIKGTLYGGKIHFLLYLASCSRDFPETSRITICLPGL